jgi:hypothetical protein
MQYKHDKTYPRLQIGISKIMLTGEVMVQIAKVETGEY